MDLMQERWDNDPPEPSIGGTSEGQRNLAATNEAFRNEMNPSVMQGHALYSGLNEHENVESLVPNSQPKSGGYGTRNVPAGRREIWSSGRPLCAKCGIRERHRTHRIRRTICLECSREAANAQARARRSNRVAERVDAGRCLLCNASRMPGIQMCEAHRQAKAARARRGAAARKASGRPTPSQTSVADAKKRGVCTTCHRRPPQGEGYATCRVCIAYIANARKARRDASKNATVRGEAIKDTPAVRDAKGSASDPILLEDSEDSAS
ncbi:hypothetical protein DL766_010413 [Monosporascus sp. MC13-8B]|uniref:Stc1 domain-containing protein n=1 Tax=Monosporascus cannonballus TaxID=155416 RepID=A0ABY0HI18_9PEZI|nr:hypothetical protein DL763_004531 [Monosporascus cannonballus]RYO93898.1 hypothetical protein DL762_000853 [Monosporascus cannonballus]RYP02326.1 hypothetical protein DL766_010413 [Monosporascus sp. MC13-8B]